MCKYRYSLPSNIAIQPGIKQIYRYIAMNIRF